MIAYVPLLLCLVYGAKHKVDGKSRLQEKGTRCSHLWRLICLQWARKIHGSKLYPSEHHINNSALTESPFKPVALIRSQFFNYLLFRGLHLEFLQQTKARNVYSCELEAKPSGQSINVLRLEVTRFLFLFSHCSTSPLSTRERSAFADA